jgi:hypothetical protein
MSIQNVLRELWPAITGPQLQKIADAIVEIHGPVPEGQTVPQFCEAWLKQEIKNRLKSAIHRARQVDDQAAQAAVDTEYGDEVV